MKTEFATSQGPSKARPMFADKDKELAWLHEQVEALRKETKPTGYIFWDGWRWGLGFGLLIGFAAPILLGWLAGKLWP